MPFPPSRKVGGRRRSTKERVRAICGAAKRGRDSVCMRPPGWGTDHPGVGRCVDHSGNSKTELKKALKVASTQVGGDMLLWDGPPMGHAVEVEPIDALLWCVHVAAGEVQYLTFRISQLTHDDVVGRPRRTVHEHGEGEKGHKDFHRDEELEESLHILIAERQKAMERLARFSKMALDAGVAERTVALAERQGDLIAQTLQLVLERLGINEERTPKTMARLERILPDVLLSLEAPTSQAVEVPT